MKKNLAALILIVSTPLAATQGIAGKVTTLTGKGQIFESGQWLPAQVGSVVYPISSVQTGYNSKMIITLKNGAQILLKQNTTLSFAQLTQASEGSNVEVHLANGGVNAFLPKADPGKENQFRVRTPTAVAGVRGSFMSATRHGGHFQVKALHSPATMEPAIAPTEADVTRQSLLQAAAESESLALTTQEAKACLNGSDPKLSEGARTRMQDAERSSSEVNTRLNTLKLVASPGGAADNRPDVQAMRVEIKETKQEAAAAQKPVVGFDRNVKISEGNGAATEAGRVVSPYQMQIIEVRPFQPYLPGQTRNEAIFMFNNMDNKAGLGNDFQRLFNTINRQRQPTNIVVPTIRTF